MLNAADTVKVLQRQTEPESFADRTSKIALCPPPRCASAYKFDEFQIIA
jgi:hypothetical protein